MEDHGLQSSDVRHLRGVGRFAPSGVALLRGVVGHLLPLRPVHTRVWRHSQTALERFRLQRSLAFFFTDLSLSFSSSAFIFFIIVISPLLPWLVPYTTGASLTKTCSKKAVGKHSYLNI